MYSHYSIGCHNRVIALSNLIINIISISYFKLTFQQRFPRSANLYFILIIIDNFKPPCFFILARIKLNLLCVVTRIVLVSSSCDISHIHSCFIIKYSITSKVHTHIHIYVCKCGFIFIFTCKCTCIHLHIHLCR